MYLNKNIHTNIPKYLLSIKICVHMCMNTNIYKYNSQTRNNMLNVVMSGL